MIANGRRDWKIDQEQGFARIKEQVRHNRFPSDVFLYQRRQYENSVLPEPTPATVSFQHDPEYPKDFQKSRLGI